MPKIRVLCGGCFDVLHIGHIDFLKRAKNLGNHLTVLLESDENTKRIKGGGRPFHNEKERSEILKSLKYVDEVVILPNKPDKEAYIDFIKRCKPDIIAITEGDPIKSIKEEHAKLVGAEIKIIKKYKSTSTTQILKLLKLE